MDLREKIGVKPIDCVFAMIENSISKMSFRVLVWKTINNILINGDRIIGRRLVWHGLIMSLIWGQNIFELFLHEPSRAIRQAVGCEGLK